ncbi:MAG: PqqD family protein [Bauldia sp.]|nr:PqqD family protein [Bauldia sp.]
MHDCLVANSARFPDQTIDDETLLFDAETGQLLLLTGFGSILWSGIGAGVRPTALCEEIGRRFGADAAVASGAFLDDLVAAGILVASQEPAPAEAATPLWPEQFTAPGIERYDDIAKIIAMDPIHDVDATTGWPRVAADKT